MPGGVRAQPSRSRLGPGDDDSGDDLARSSIDPEDVTAYQEVVYRPPRENDSECDSDEDPTAQEEEDSVPGLFGAFRRRALTAAEREEKAARFVQRSFRNRQRRRAGPGEDDENDAIGSWKGTSAPASSSAGPFPSFPERNERKLSELSETAAATRLQSTWRGKRAREEVKDVKALRDFAIGDAVSHGGANARKKREGPRRKVRGGVHGGTLRVVIRHVHFLRGVFLHVHVVGASDLLAMDSNGLSDPYVKVTLVDLDGVAYQRQVNRTPFEFATLEPKWNVSFFMGAADLNLRQTKLRFEVFDYDQWSADDPMGVAEFPLVVFDPDEQHMIRRAAKWRSKKRREARARARGNAVSPAPSPAFLPGGIGGLLRTSSAVKREREEDARFAAGTLDVDGESDAAEESDEAESDLTDPDSPAPSRSSPAGRGSPKKASYFKRLVRGSTDLTHPVHSVKGFGEAFNKDRKSQARMLMRAGVFGLDKPLVQQNGERVGEMCWYSRARAYGTLNVVYNDGFSRFSQEAGALLKQAGSFVSMATVGKTVKTLGVGDFLSSKVEAAVDVGKRRAVNVVEAVLGETKQKLCDDLTKDRDMPNGVRKVFQSVVGVYFSEVQQEVLDELARRLKTLSYSEKKQTRRKRDKQSILLQIGISTWYEYFTLKYLRKLVLDFRAWYLYNELPYDKSFWGKLRSPGWWIILTTKLYSGWGIQAFLYAMRLLMLDRTDEWQLFEYISNFKGIQFLSGVIAMFQGVLMYMECAGLVTQSSPHTCEINGPGSDQRALCATDGLSNIACASVVGVGFFIRILLTWYAFFLMRRSFSFGKPIFNDQRLVGAVIEIHEIRKGTKQNWKWLRWAGACAADLGASARAGGKKAFFFAVGREPTPLERFRAAVVAVIEDIKRNDPRWIVRNEGHHTVYVKAKVVAYSVKSGLHTMYYLGGGSDERDQEEVDLKKKLFSVVTLKQMQPRRLQLLIFYYDVVVFAFVIVVCARVISMLDLVNDDWQLFGLLYWIQCFYSVLAFPFVCIVIPGVQSLICHAKVTGYDEYGVLQAKIKREDFASVYNEDEKEEAPRSRYVPACYPLFQGANLKRKL